MFDFVIIAIIDFALQEYDGDLFFLGEYYAQHTGTAFMGYIWTFIIQFGLLILNTFIYYWYIVFIHNGGRIADIYLRISGKGKNFYCPDDNEISYKCLKQEYMIAEINDNRIICNPIKIEDTRIGKQKIAKLLHFYKYRKYSLSFLDSNYLFFRERYATG